MPIKAILVGASGGTASNGAIELACRLAAHFGANLEAIHIKVDVEQVMMAAGAAGGVMPLDSGWIGQMIAREQEVAAQTEITFADTCARHQLPLAPAAAAGWHGARWHEETGDASTNLAGRARFFDLVVLGRSERVVEEPHTDAIEQVLIQSGRPVLLAPADAPAAFGTTIAIAWNGSAEAVRATVAALPFLVDAKAVAIITLEEQHEASADALKDYLALHGAPAKVRHFLAVPGLRPGEQLLSSAREEGADLLVMGGYSRAPWRQTLFGGASRTVISTSLMPLLLAH